VLLKYEYRARVASVYDGDTIRVNIDLGFDTWKLNETIRLYGIDTPEIRGAERPEGLIAKDYVVSKLPVGKEITILTLRDRKEKYGRYLAIVFCDGVNLNEELVDKGLAREYLK
jgi:micrococcal nuclease